MGPKDPTSTQSKPKGIRRVVAAPSTRTVVRVVPLAQLKLRLEDESGEVLKHKAYTLSWRDISGVPALSFTAGDGVLTETIPAGATVADLTVGEMDGQSTFEPGWKLVVRLTTLGEPDSPEGVAARLSNLGSLVAPTPGPTDDPNLAPWAAGHPEDIREGALTYHYRTKDQMAESYSDIYQRIEKDHDKG